MAFHRYFRRHRLASAVRPEEVYAALKRYATERDGSPVDEAALWLLEALRAENEQAAPFMKGRRFLLARREVAAFEAWFETAQDRAQQWFQLHVRGLTIGASAFLALLFQLDAVEVFRFVSMTSASRNALLASADRTIQEAEGALDERGGLLARVAAAWATERNEPPVDLAGITHTGQLQARLAERDSKFHPPEFERIVQTTTTAYYRDRSAKLRELSRGVSATGFELIPQNYWRWPSPHGPIGSLANIIPHLPGIALFAALLTLGAPYWYNLLKNLTSLRPALAQLINKEETASSPASGS